MLLLFLSIFLQYDLPHCGEAAKPKDVFLDYSMTQFWWNGTPGIDQTDRITPQYSFLTTPYGWMMSEEDYRPPEIPEKVLETFFPFPNVTRPAYPFDIKKDTVVTVHPDFVTPWHLLYPGLTPPPNFPSGYKYPVVSPYTDGQVYIPSPTGPTPRGPSFTFPEVNRPDFQYRDKDIEHQDGPDSNDFTTYTDKPYLETTDPDTTYPTSTRKVLVYMKKWQELTSYAVPDSRMPTNVVPMLSEVFNYDDYATQRVRGANRRNSKIPQVASSKVKSIVFEDQTRSILREEITEVERKEVRDLEFEDKASSYDPSKESAIQKLNKQTLTTVTKQSRNTDDDNDIKKTTTQKNDKKLSKVMETLERPTTIPRGESWQSDHTVTWTPTTVKDFLRQNIFVDSYFEMIKTLHEGYMMVFLIELTRLIATKESKAIRDVVKHTDLIIHGFFKRERLLWFGQPLTDVARKFARFLKDSAIDVIQSHAANLHHMLSERSQELSVEVNAILEYADMLYDDDEGRLLFDALKEFAAYPNSYWVCNSLIHNFLRPYRRLKDTQQVQELIDSVNLELKARLTWSGFNEEPPLRDGDVTQAVGSPDETKLLTQTKPVTQSEPHSDSTWSPRKRKRKRHHRSHKRKRERKRYKDTDLT